MLISRRSALKGLGAATIAAGATSLAAPVLSQGLTKVTFTTSWIPEGPNLFAYVARDGLKRPQALGQGRLADVKQPRRAPDAAEIRRRAERPELDQVRGAHRRAGALGRGPGGRDGTCR